MLSVRMWYTYVSFLTAWQLIAVSTQTNNVSTNNKVEIAALLELASATYCKDNARTEENLGFGLSMALAGQFVIDQLDSSLSDLAVPGVQYDLLIKDVCDDEALSVRSAGEVIPTHVWRTDDKACSNQSSAENSLLIGFLGPLKSANTVTTAEFLYELNIPQITPSATASSLSNRKHYSLFRTGIPDDLQVKAIVEAALEMGWSYALLVHTDDSYGTGAASALKAYAGERSLCLSNIIKVSNKKDEPYGYFKNISKIIQNDPASGIIYFGQEPPAVKIIDWYLADQPSKRKQLISSDGIGRSETVLNHLRSSGNNSKLDIVVVSSAQPSANQLEPFLSYVHHKYNNPDSSTPQLKLLLNEFKSGCRPASKCTSDNLLKATEYVIEMIKATASMLNAFKQTHTDLCGESHASLCDEVMNSSLFYSVLRDQVQNTNAFISMDKLNFTLNFNSFGGVISDSTKPAYTLNHLHRVGGNLTYENVASYFHNGSWLPRLESRLKSHCITDCADCALNRPPYVFRKRRSPFIIVGTGPVHKSRNQYSCGDSLESTGFIRMEAFYYAVERINDITGIEFSTLFIDLCYAKIRAHRILTEIFHNTSAIRLLEIDGTEHVLSASHFAVFFGDSSSDISIILQTYLEPHNILQISYTSTSTYLSDPSRYPTFLRNVPSDRWQAELMINLVLKHGWDNVGLLHSDSAYGTTAANLIKEYAKQNNICISFLEKIELKTVKNVTLRMKAAGEQEKLPRPIFLVVERDRLQYIIGNISLYDSQWKTRGNFFIASETWGTNKEVIDGNYQYVYGSLTVSIDDRIHNWTGSETDINYFKEFVRKRTFENQYDNELFLKFWQQHFQCRLPNFNNPFSKECLPEKNLVDDRDEDELDFEDAVSKHIVGAGLSFAYAVRESIYGEQICSTKNNCSEVFFSKEGRDSLFRLVQTTKIPTQVREKSKTYLPFLVSREGRKNYKVYNIRDDQTFHLVYEVVDGKLIQKKKPLFYKNSEQQTVLNSPLWPGSNCLAGRASNDNPTTPAISPPRYSISKTALLATIIVLLVISIAAVILAAYGCFKLQMSSKLDLPAEHTEPTEPLYQETHLQPASVVENGTQHVTTMTLSHGPYTANQAPAASPTFITHRDSQESLIRRRPTGTNSRYVQNNTEVGDTPHMHHLKICYPSSSSESQQYHHIYEPSSLHE